ncbi:MAG: RagB/SusD family nutrient uptake outer membrane protein [Gracilimonas sp.]
MSRLKLILVTIVITAFTACDVLDSPEPQQSLPADEGLETVADFESALNGAYNNVQEFSNGDNSGQLAFLNDIITDDAVWTGSFPTYVEVSAQQMSPSNGSITGQWNGAYEAINSANIILDNLDNLEADQAVIDDFRGQALFIRALEYYYLVQYFSLPWGATADNSHDGVPLQLESVTSDEDFSNPSRATVQEVYDQIITDLETADGLIQNTTPNKATNAAVTGLLARIALIQGEWTEAANYAGEITGDNAFSLGGSVTEYFQSELSDESIFEIQHTTQDVPDPANTSLTAVYNPGTRDDIQISQPFLDATDALITDDQQTALDAVDQSVEDTRVTQLLEGTTAGDSNSLKYEDVVNAADNVPIMRLSEMMLTRAEALAEDANTLLDVPQEAFDLVNEIRTRAMIVTDNNGAPTDPSIIEYDQADFNDKEEFIDAILLERRVELAFEGHRKTDLQRRGEDVGGTAWDAPNLVFPIPESQIDANDNIDQNDGYN